MFYSFCPRPDCRHIASQQCGAHYSPDLFLSPLVTAMCHLWTNMPLQTFVPYVGTSVTQLWASVDAWVWLCSGLLQVNHFQSVYVSANHCVTFYCTTRYSAVNTESYVLQLQDSVSCSFAGKQPPCWSDAAKRAQHTESTLIHQYCPVRCSLYLSVHMGEISHCHIVPVILRYELRIRYLPKGYLSHFSEDKPSLNYLYHQVRTPSRIAEKEEREKVYLLWIMTFIDTCYTRLLPIIYILTTLIARNHWKIHSRNFAETWNGMMMMLCHSRWKVTICNI